MTLKSQDEWQELTKHRFAKAESYASQGGAFLALFGQKARSWYHPPKLSTTQQKKMYGKAASKGESFAARMDTWLAYLA